MIAKLSQLLAACLLVLTSAAALAQYPSRPIRLIVPIPAGGAPDIAARVVGQKLSDLLDVAVVVDNHAGSNGNIAGDMVGEFYPGYEVTIWLALFAPAGTPDAVLVPLRAAVQKALTSANVKQKLNAAGGLEPFVTTPDEFTALIRRDYDKYGKIVKSIGIKVD